jgi:hypothetical protein
MWKCGGAQACWNSISFKPLFSKIRLAWGVPPTCSGTLHQSLFSKKEGLRHFMFEWNTKIVEIGSVYCTFTVIPWLTKIIRSGITFISRNVISHRLSGVSLLAVSKVNNPIRLVDLPYVIWSAHFFVTHIQTEKISSSNGLTVHVCCFMLARASTKTFVSRIHIC